MKAEDLNEVSRSVLQAETWLRTQVLAHYPASQITTIVVGNNVLCQNRQEHAVGLVLSSLKNIHYSLTRWSLEKDIKVSAVFSSSCFNTTSIFYSEDLAEQYIRSLLKFLQETNSTYSVIAPPNFNALPIKAMNLESSHSEFMKKLGFFELKKLNVIVKTQKEVKSMNRKLSSLNPNNLDPFPARPTPSSDSPLHSSIGFSAPANVAPSPHTPISQIATPPKMTGIAPPPEMSFSSTPEVPPEVDSATPPFGFGLPPCSPTHIGAPAPEMGLTQKLWCVAKPTVPAETLQEAIDYACGAGGADCEEITPHGNCYYPDSAAAHASYAFNSYWQKNKKNGGSCSFGGTAMLIHSDPSKAFFLFLLLYYLHVLKLLL